MFTYTSILTGSLDHYSKYTSLYRSLYCTTSVYCFPQLLHPFAFPPVHKDSSFSISSLMLVVFCVFDNSCSDRYEVISHCDLDLHFSDGEQC